jgi:chromosome segregation ATPase
MTATVVLALVAAIVSAISSLIAASATRKWGPEFERAKNEIIRAKEAQIISLQKTLEIQRELSPSVLREAYKRMREHLEDYVHFLEGELQKARERTQEMESKLSSLERDTSDKAKEVAGLESERGELTNRLASLESKIRVLYEVQQALRRGEETQEYPSIPDEQRNPWFG